MFTATLSENAQESLALLGKSRLLENAYLAGGSALALQLGHRYFYDFDFFAKKSFNHDLLVKKLKEELPQFRLKEKSEGTISGYLGKTRFSINCSRICCARRRPNGGRRSHQYDIECRIDGTYSCLSYFLALANKLQPSSK